MHGYPTGYQRHWFSVTWILFEFGITSHWSSNEEHSDLFTSYIIWQRKFGEMNWVNILHQNYQIMEIWLNIFDIHCIKSEKTTELKEFHHIGRFYVVHLWVWRITLSKSLFSVRVLLLLLHLINFYAGFEKSLNFVLQISTLLFRLQILIWFPLPSGTHPFGTCHYQILVCDILIPYFNGDFNICSYQFSFKIKSSITKVKLWCFQFNVLHLMRFEC